MTNQDLYLGNQDLYMNHILAGYFPQGSWRIHAGDSGRNNTTRYVETRGGRFVLRIYETHQDESRVRYEHAVLLALGRISLPFRTPTPVFTPGGETTVRTEDGKIAALFHYIDGTNPTLVDASHLESFGWAAGCLVGRLKKVNVDLEPVYRPYYEIEHTHPRCPIQDVLEFCGSPTREFTQHKAALARVGEQLAVFREAVPRLKALPHQLIHGDLNASNVLAGADGRISAVLDFEFVTEDLRVMEAAVCLSDLIRQVEPEAILWEGVERFLKGYGSAMKLTEEEISVLPLLIQLRRLDVFIHFLGRYRDGIDSLQMVFEQIHNVTAQAGWLDTRRSRLLTLCGRHLRA